MSPGNIPNSSCLPDLIIFDLDDTLIDTRQRHYQVYQDFLAKHSTAPLSFPAYVSKRAGGLKNKDIIALHDAGLVTGFEEFWRGAIESPEYLSFDREIVEAELLGELKGRTSARFVILSLRSNEQTARRQFGSLPFAFLFDEAIFTGHRPGENPKTEAINNLKTNFDILFFAGDSDPDAEAAASCGIPFFGVATGWKKPEAEPVFPNINALLKNQIREFQR